MFGERREDLLRDHAARGRGEDTTFDAPWIPVRQKLIELGSSDSQADRELRQFHAGSACFP